MNYWWCDCINLYFFCISGTVVEILLRCGIHYRLMPWLIITSFTYQPALDSASGLESFTLQSTTRYHGRKAKRRRPPLWFQIPSRCLIQLHSLSWLFSELSKYGLLEYDRTKTIWISDSYKWTSPVFPTISWFHFRDSCCANNSYTWHLLERLRAFMLPQTRRGGISR